MMANHFYWLLDSHGRTPLGDLFDDITAGGSLSSADPLVCADPRYHLGARLPIGLYCHDCGAPLSTYGVPTIHNMRLQPPPFYSVQQTCYVCHQHAPVGNGSPNPIEAKEALPSLPTQRPTGIAPSGAFVWAQQPERVIAVCNEWLWRPLVEDTSGALYTGQQFVALLDWGCPVQFTQTIGVWFV